MIEIKVLLCLPHLLMLSIQLTTNCTHQAEGYRYLARLVRGGLENFLEAADPQAPKFVSIANGYDSQAPQNTVKQHFFLRSQLPYANTCPEIRQHLFLTLCSLAYIVVAKDMSSLSTLQQDCSLFAF